MNNKTELEKVKAEIESKKEEKEKYEKQLSQLKNQEKKLKKMASLEERRCAVAYAGSLLYGTCWYFHE